MVVLGPTVGLWRRILVCQRRRTTPVLTWLFLFLSAIAATALIGIVADAATILTGCSSAQTTPVAAAFLQRVRRPHRTRRPSRLPFYGPTLPSSSLHPPPPIPSCRPFSRLLPPAGRPLRNGGVTTIGSRTCRSVGLKNSQVDDHEPGASVDGSDLSSVTQRQQQQGQPSPNKSRSRHNRDPLEIGSSTGNGITYLGEGSEAIVRLGCVLVAPRHENGHFLRRASILVYAMGETPGSGEYVVRGLLLDHPTAFTVADVMPGLSNDDDKGEANPLSCLTVFRGGDTGRDGLILLQDRSGVVGAGVSDDGESNSSRDSDSPFSSSSATTAIEIADGLYHGGWDEALFQAVASVSRSQPLSAQGSGTAADADSADAVAPVISATTATTTFDVRRFKVFFNYLEFTEAQLEEMLADGGGNDGNGDRWMSLQVPANIVVSSEYASREGALWSHLRTAVAQIKSSPPCSK